MASGILLGSVSRDMVVHSNPILIYSELDLMFPF